MEGLKEISDIFRKVSLASSGNPENIYVKEPSHKKQPPKDTFFLVHLLFLLLGLLHVVPLTFFITANGYWMYKFRDTSSEEVDLNNKTTLQVYFASGTMISQAVPMVLCMLLSTALGHIFKVRHRIISTLAVITIIFVVFDFFIYVDTDTWQTGFFILSMVGFAIICGVLTLYQTSSLTLVPKFPPHYMNTFLFGEGVAGIFNALLQVISLSIGTSVKTSAIVYFLSGTTLIILTLVLYIVSKNLSFYKFHMENTVENVGQHRLTLEEGKQVVKRIWPCLTILLISLINLFWTHPAVTTLVVSEDYGHGYAWNDTYFVPTITYLFNEICGLFGRVLSKKPWITHSNSKWWLLIMILRLFITVPLVLLCNAKPRSHLPVVFPHDWEYILILVFIATTNGFIFNNTFLSTPQLAQGHEEAALLILMCVAGVSGGLLAPTSLLPIRLL